MDVVVNWSDCFAGANVRGCDVLLVEPLVDAFTYGLRSPRHTVATRSRIKRDAEQCSAPCASFRDTVQYHYYSY
jgi:hypothetical protein